MNLCTGRSLSTAQSVDPGLSARLANKLKLNSEAQALLDELPSIGASFGCQQETGDNAADDSTDEFQLRMTMQLQAQTRASRTTRPARKTSIKV